MNRRDFLKLIGKGTVAVGVVAVTGLPKVEDSLTVDWGDTLSPSTQWEQIGREMVEGIASGIRKYPYITSENVILSLEDYSKVLGASGVHGSEIGYQLRKALLRVGTPSRRNEGIGNNLQ